MSFADWVKNGWLVALRAASRESLIGLGIVARDPKDSQAKDVSCSNYMVPLVILMSYQKSGQISSKALGPA